MKPTIRIAILAVVVVAAGTIAVIKSLQRPEPTAAPPATPARHIATAITPPAAPSTSRNSVLLFANLSEAGEGEDGCALIIRTIRAARERGISVTEYDSGSSPDVRKQHRVVVEPTVIVLDGSGREVARHEGEDAATISAIRADIERVSGGKA